MTLSAFNRNDLSKSCFTVNIPWYDFEKKTLTHLTLHILRPLLVQSLNQICWYCFWAHFNPHSIVTHERLKPLTTIAVNSIIPREDSPVDNIHFVFGLHISLLADIVNYELCVIIYELRELIFISRAVCLSLLTHQVYLLMFVVWPA